MSIRNEGSDAASAGSASPGPAPPGPAAPGAASAGPVTEAATADGAFEPAPRDPVADALLDAAHQCIAAFGLRRLTLTDVARRAGVSRPTVYRRWRDIHTLVADLLTREVRSVLLTAAEEAGRPPQPGRTRERLVRLAAGLLPTLRSHPLLSRILETEPEALVTYTFQRLGSSQRGALELLRPEIAAGQADGSIRAGAPEELARMVMLLVQTAATSWRLVDDVLPLDRLTGELRHLLDAYLRPGGTDGPPPPAEEPTP
ncbi:TetR/AcrR family transcriptional regulator [Streptomyces sp. JJ36]|uniref:TetR/AcrR family transcriptional regulator n=1 Tax=Streptomyces sp. JJ36 TaxID=2736645 RepID=UPI001F4011E4|nr:TetR/AcrR family transcriptional regulator [Streptomyces sp. JJ36]MCF6524979.1 TetR/AcrR family transcriptional regulator [Streptomyces sp. JJ36]